MKDPRVSVAIPLFNEEEGIPQLLSRVRAVLHALPGGPHQMVLVDDGSSDRTAEMLAEAAETTPPDAPHLVAVSLSRNFGHQAALSAALDHADGDVIVFMDGDLQDPPEVIPAFLEKHRQGFDVVYGLRARRKGSLFLKLAYYIFYRLIDALSGIRMPLDSGDFSLISRAVADVIRQAPEHHRYLRGLRTWAGFRQTGLPIDRPERAHGTTKYSLSKLFKLAFDGIFAFSVVPLRAASAIGGLSILASSGFAIYSCLLYTSPSPRD